jgi:O-phospho-L-seryl-tRNASec:L-selenocysteinyl-tRNA synthase
LGRVDLVVQSTDKNLLVPVGGAIIASFNEQPLKQVSELYAGRASSSQSLDTLITLLSMGGEKLKQLLDERKELFAYLKVKLNELAEKYGEKVIETTSNNVSMALSLKNFVSSNSEKELTQIGSMLYTRNVSGVRVLTQFGNEKEIVQGIKLKNYGTHVNNYSVAYLTASAAIGVQKDEIDLFVKRLDKILDSIYSKVESNEI